ncbi:MAG: aldose 1-epimerase [Erythrobacter sp.]|nr:aldose 1-epimerase [Erythrobacter sp.]
MIRLESGPSMVEIDPALGGSIVSARWHGMDIMRPMQGDNVLGASSFPLVPYSNRIAGSVFSWRGEEVSLKPNHPGDPASPAIHGVGWTSEWKVIDLQPASTRLELEHTANVDWPWSFVARQDFVLADRGLHLSLSLEHADDSAMPAGLGFHPFFPRSSHTLYRGLHRGEWETDAGCIPTRLRSVPAPQDWWQGRPVETRIVDTVYTEREGPLTIEWPERGIGLMMVPSDDLAFTTVYVPTGEDFFCVEPVTHMTDAFNRDLPDSGTRLLEAGESWSVDLKLEYFRL